MISVYLFCRAKFDESDRRFQGHYKRDDDPSRYPKLIYREFCAGQSRFGWGNENPNPAQRTLDRIRPGDWIVHVNTPSDGLCAAGRVLSCLKRDGGLRVDWTSGCDFQNCFDIDTCSIVKFRRDKTKLGDTLHKALCPRNRAQRMSAPIVPCFLDYLGMSAPSHGWHGSQGH